jgi:energy-coupling factor transport system substrate-specific component
VAVSAVSAPTTVAGEVGRAVGGARSGGVYVIICLLGAAAFLYPFWLPSSAVAGQGHARFAPLLAAALVSLLVLAVGLELRRHRINGVTVALLGLLAATTGLMRLLELPGGGSGMFPLLVLAGAAFGARFGLLLGMSSMMLSATITGGMGPWLPFQMLAAGWMGGCAGLMGRGTRRLPATAEVAVLAAFGWVWGFVYGAIMNLWFWPFTVGQGPLSWEPGAGLLGTLEQYHGFYMVTSFAWDAAGALANAVVILALGRPLLASLRRFAHRLDPVAEFTDSPARGHATRSATHGGTVAGTPSMTQ